jgi:hypothetical protein
MGGFRPRRFVKPTSPGPKVCVGSFVEIAAHQAGKHSAI